MKYSEYPAVFTKEGEYYSVSFPDFENVKPCFTSGKGLKDAIEMANDVLCLTLYELEQKNIPAPAASKIEILKVGKDEFAQFIACDTDFYKEFFKDKSVKKNVTIPSNLNAMAVKAGINFSFVLQEALKQKLHFE